MADAPQERHIDIAPEPEPLPGVRFPSTNDMCSKFLFLSGMWKVFFLVKLLGICYYGELRAVCLPQGVNRSIAQAAYGKQYSGRPGALKKRPVTTPIVACQSEA
ncbi:hypothetical protein EDD85DRAFT_940244 [Armillaria nabsnona]|nr:hypothetical protein EDD85DRAFT_940244 [Armillaria nabsnona]